MGRHNHENSVAIPGYGNPVVLSGDDSFVTTPEQSQLYSYIARNSNGVWNDEGDLWAFVADGVDDYFDFPISSNMSVTGKFVKVPKDIATGRKPDGTDLMAADMGYPPPPNDGTGSATPVTGLGRSTARSGCSSTGATRRPQRVFQFMRVEDIAYDKRPGMQNVVYVVDSGRGATSRRRRLPRRTTVDERPRLEARARQERPDEGDVVLDPDRGRRRPGQGVRTRSTSRTTSSRRRRAS